MNQNRQSHDDRAGKKPNGDPKREPVNHKASYWDEMTVSLNYIFSEQFGGLLIAGALFACLLVPLLAFNLKWVWWISIALILFATLAAWAHIRVARSRSAIDGEKGFSITVITAFLSTPIPAQEIPSIPLTGENVRGFWFVTGPPGPKKMSHLSHCLFVRFTNLSNRTYIITSYEIEVMTTAGWKVVPSIPAQFGTVIHISDPKQARSFRSRNFFNTVITNHNIAANESVHGWLFFHFPERSLSVKDKFRFRIRTTTGLESTEEIAWPEPGNDLESAIEGSNLDVTALTEAIDVTGIPVEWP